MRLVSQPKYPWFFPDFWVRYIHTPAAKLLKKNTKLHASESRKMLM